MRYVLVIVALVGCGDRGISTNERARLLAMPPVWTAAARAERCPRAALRTPVTGDRSARLAAMSDKSSPEQQCLARVKELRTELGPCAPQEHCGPQTLATVKPHPDVVAACAPLYAAIDDVAHASEACTSTSVWNDDNVVSVLSLGNAVRLEVAPLAARGQLGEAARRVLDAIRFADDFARKSAVLGEMSSTAAAFRLADTLDELASDPRLTADDARAIARDLDVLLATSPRWDVIMRQEDAWGATFALTHDHDPVPELARFDARERELQRVCRGTLRGCVEHIDAEDIEGAGIFIDYAKRLGQRDYLLAFVRMQIELRLARPEDCNNPLRRRALVQPWADRAIVGDEAEPVVTPPAWQRITASQQTHAPRVLHCVPAMI